MPRQGRSSAPVGSQVRFEYKGRELTGTVARLEPLHALILGTDRQSYRILRDCLQPLPAPAPGEGTSARDRYAPTGLDPCVQRGEAAQLAFRLLRAVDRVCSIGKRSQAISQ